MLPVDIEMVMITSLYRLALTSEVTMTKQIADNPGMALEVLHSLELVSFNIFHRISSIILRLPQPIQHACFSILTY